MSDIKSDSYDAADAVIGVGGGDDDEISIANGVRKSQKKFQVSRSKIVDRRSRIAKSQKIQ